MPGTSHRFPAADEYNSAVQQPQSAFQDPDLQQGQVEYLPPHRLYPWGRSGRFAVVYRIETPTNPPRAWAVRCFLQHYTDYMERYDKIHHHLAQKRLRYFVDFEYQEKGIRVGTEWYPIVKMEWVEGTPLIKFIKANLHRADQLKDLAQQWVTMLEDLRTARIAHGDLQHGNILISNTTGELKLVDYDGMWVPALSGMGSHEIGHPNYQHPNRSEKDFGDYLDNFSGWLIYTALLALANEPGLWKQFGGDEHLLFQKNDLYNPNASQLFRHLRSHSNPEVRAAAEQLYNSLQIPFDKVPPLRVPLLSPTTRSALAIVQAWKDPQKRHWAEQQLLKLNVTQITAFLELFEYSDPSISADVKQLFTVLVQKHPNPTIEALVKGLEHNKLIIRKESANIIRYTKLNHAKVHSALWRRLEIPDEDFDVQREVLNALQHIEGDHAIVKALLTRLEDRATSVRQAASTPKVVAALLNWLEDQDASVRQAAARALGQLRAISPEVVAALLNWLEDEDWSIRQAAAEALGQLQAASPEVVAALTRRWVKDTEPSVRSAAEDALRQLQVLPHAALPTLLELLEDPKPDVRQRAIEILQTFGLSTPEVVAALTKRLEDEAASVRQAAAEALGQLQVASPEVVTALLLRLRDTQGDVRRAALEALLQLQVPTHVLLPVLGTLLQDPDAEVLSATARGLLQLRAVSPEVVTALLKRFEDANPSIRQAAAEALGQLQAASPEVVAALTRRWVKDTEPSVRSAAEDALRQLQVLPHAALPTLLQLLEDPNPDVRQRAIVGLQTFGLSTPEVVAALLVRLEDEAASVRGAAARALGQLQVASPEVIAALAQRVVADPDPPVAQEATSALETLLSKGT